MRNNVEINSVLKDLLPDFIMAMEKNPAQIICFSLVCHAWSESILANVQILTEHHFRTKEGLIRYAQDKPIKFVLFNMQKDIQKRVALLEEFLSIKKHLKGMCSLRKQLQIDQFLTEDSDFAILVIKKLLLSDKLNIADNYQITILHHLILFGYFECAEIVLKNDAFKRINTRCHLPVGYKIHIASALDFAISCWIRREVESDFIESILRQSALPLWQPNNHSWIALLLPNILFMFALSEL